MEIYHIQGTGLLPTLYEKVRTLSSIFLGYPLSNTNYHEEILEIPIVGTGPFFRPIETPAGIAIQMYPVKEESRALAVVRCNTSVPSIGVSYDIFNAKNLTVLACGHTFQDATSVQLELERQFDPSLKTVRYFHKQYLLLLNEGASFKMKEDVYNDRFINYSFRGGKFEAVSDEVLAVTRKKREIVFYYEEGNFEPL